MSVNDYRSILNLILKGVQRCLNKLDKNIYDSTSEFAVDFRAIFEFGEYTDLVQSLMQPRIKAEDMDLKKPKTFAYSVPNPELIQLAKAIATKPQLEQKQPIKPQKPQTEQKVANKFPASKLQPTKYAVQKPVLTESGIFQQDPRYPETSEHFRSLVPQTHPLVTSLINVFFSKPNDDTSLKLQKFLQYGHKCHEFVQLTFDQGRSFHCYLGCPNKHQSFLASAVHMNDFHGGDELFRWGIIKQDLSVFINDRINYLSREQLIEQHGLLKDDSGRLFPLDSPQAADKDSNRYKGIQRKRSALFEGMAPMTKRRKEKEILQEQVFGKRTFGQKPIFSEVAKLLERDN